MKIFRPFALLVGIAVGVTLAACCQHTVIRCGPPPCPKAPELLHRLFGEHAKEGQAHALPHPFGMGIQVFEVRFSGWPHIPSMVVAMRGSGRGEILPLSGLPPALRASDPVGNFNALARETRRSIPDAQVESYLRFFLGAYIAPLVQGDFLGTRAQAGAALHRSGNGGGSWDRSLPIDRGRGRARLVCWYRAPFEIRELDITLDQRDGTITLDDRLFGRLTQ